MLQPGLCNYSDIYILASGTITVALVAAGRWNDNVKVVFKSCASFTGWISEINNTKIDNATNTNIVMPMYNLIEYSNNYSKNQGVYGNTLEMK